MFAASVTSMVAASVSTSEVGLQQPRVSKSVPSKVALQQRKVSELFQSEAGLQQQRVSESLPSVRIP